MSKDVKEKLIKETQNFLNCDLLTAEKKADEWVGQCMNFYKTDKLIGEIKHHTEEIKAQINEAEGEEMLKDILAVAAERTITKLN